MVAKTKNVTVGRDERPLYFVWLFETRPATWHNMCMSSLLSSSTGFVAVVLPEMQLVKCQVVLSSC